MNMTLSPETKAILQRYANYYRIENPSNSYLKKVIKVTDPHVLITVSKGGMFGFLFHGLHKDKKHLIEIYRGKLTLTIFANNNPTHRTYRQEDIEEAEKILIECLNEHLFKLK